MEKLVNFAWGQASAAAEHLQFERIACTLSVLAWFTFNITMGIVTKWTYLYGKVCFPAKDECFTYDFPFMLTGFHMFVSWMVCSVLLRMRRVRYTVLGFREQVHRIAPLAMVFSGSVVMGNLSLRYIYPSFNQMLASISPLVTVLLSVVMQRRRYNAWTWASMPVICGGLCICGSTEVNYNTLGVTFVVGATTLRAAKSVMQEKLLDTREGKLDPVTLLYYQAPWAGSFLVCLSFFFEGSAPGKLLFNWAGDARTGVNRVLGLLVFSGLNACFLNISGFSVTAHVGAVMLQILGNVKACVAIAVSAAVLGNPVTAAQVTGVLLCLMGVWVYQDKGGLRSKKTERAND
mmetsp:Transcript_64974/g.141618  ORF Transcript_64974/g.141618 Transcript_64974/m.141618 type:complete len:347 (+) Transcript_64974:404-1444(+)